jgi:hypothetical protein
VGNEGLAPRGLVSSIRSILCNPISGRDTLWKSRTRCARYVFFIPCRLQEQVLDALAIKNPANFFAGLLVVDKVIEISNLEMFKDIEEIIVAFAK